LVLTTANPAGANVVVPPEAFRYNGRSVGAYLCNAAGARRYFNGRMAAVLVYNRYLTDGEVQDVEQFLWKKYFLPPQGTCVLLK